MSLKPQISKDYCQYIVSKLIKKWYHLLLIVHGGADDISSIIETLISNNVKATFFTVGDWAKKYPESIKALHTAGMEIRKSFIFSCTCKQVII